MTLASDASGMTNLYSSVSPSTTDSNTGGGNTGPEMVSWSKYRGQIGISVPNGSYDVVFIEESSFESLQDTSDNTDKKQVNFYSADVTSIGGDSDEADQTELFRTKNAEKGEDYYVASDGSFGETPPSGDYVYAIIGSSIANTYGKNLTIAEGGVVDENRLSNDVPLDPLSDVDIYDYASGLTSDDTQMVDGSNGLSFSNDYTSNKADSDVDGTVTGIQTWTVDGTDTAAQFGEVSVSNVNSSVNEITVTVKVDGDQVKEVSDSDFSDGEKLDDGVKIADTFEQAEEKVTVEVYYEFDDTDMTSAGTLSKVTLDDTDDDSSNADGSYGFSAVTQTFTGY